MGHRGAAFCQTSRVMNALGPLLVLDSASLYYRSFHAMPSSMVAPDGRPHGALRGFLSTLTRLIEAHAPCGVLAAWDEDWRPAWRVDLVPSYKAHRVAAAGAEDEPEGLPEQAEAIADLLDALGVPRLGVAGFEADDVIGSVVTQESRWPSGCSGAIVVSGDRDLIQLINGRTALLLTVNGGMEKWPLLDPEAAEQRFGVRPDAYVDMAVLRGDPSDGLPGVPGVGPKTAMGLISSFGDLDEVIRLAHSALEGAPAARPMTARIAERIVSVEDELRRARRVTTVVRDLDLPADLFSGNRGMTPSAREIGARWGVERQVRELVRALGHSDPV